MLAREAQQILHDAMSALRLLVKLFGVFDSLRAHLAAGAEQLAVAENGGERIVEFVSDAGNQLSDGGHFFAVQKLFLSAAKVVDKPVRVSSYSSARSIALEIWLPTAISKLMSAGENSRGVRVPTDQTAERRSLDQRTTVGETISSFFALRGRSAAAEVPARTEMSREPP